MLLLLLEASSSSDASSSSSSSSSSDAAPASSSWSRGLYHFLHSPPSIPLVLLLICLFCSLSSEQKKPWICTLSLFDAYPSCQNRERRKSLFLILPISNKLIHIKSSYCPFPRSISTSDCAFAQESIQIHKPIFLPLLCLCMNIIAYCFEPSDHTFKDFSIELTVPLW
jgi:hypothetical protein